MKRLLSLLLVCSLVLSSAAATGGDPNIEGGGGGVGEGGVVGDSAWNPGDDGVRVSVMRGNTAVATFDISNILRTRTQWCYVKKNKLTYKNNGGTLDPMPGANYRNYVPPADIPLPTIIPDSARNNIEAIRNYFTDERVVHFVADKAGMAYDELINGDYKLLLEPIAYFKYNGVQYAMTATEAALFDMKVSGDLRYQMGRMTHQNLPFSMFLERADLTIQPWTGATSGRQANIDILNQLGVGIVSFQPEILIPDPPQAEYVYRCDTDVITAALVVNRGGNLTPYTHSEAGGQVGYATFHINGGNYRKQMVCPAGGTQLVWVRWHTPSTPQEMTITVTPPNGGRDIQILASIVELPEKTPPNPEYDGPGEGPGITHTQYRPNFRLADPPSWGSQVRTEWDQWIATLESEYIEDEDWVWNLKALQRSLSLSPAFLISASITTALRLHTTLAKLLSAAGIPIVFSTHKRFTRDYTCTIQRPISATTGRTLELNMSHKLKLVTIRSTRSIISMSWPRGISVWLSSYIATITKLLRMLP